MLFIYPSFYKVIEGQNPTETLFDEVHQQFVQPSHLRENEAISLLKVFMNERQISRQETLDDEQ